MTIALSLGKNVTSHKMTTFYTKIDNTTNHFMKILKLKSLGVQSTFSPLSFYKRGIFTETMQLITSRIPQGFKFRFTFKYCNSNYFISFSRIMLFNSFNAHVVDSWDKVFDFWDHSYKNISCRLPLQKVIISL